MDKSGRLFYRLDDYEDKTGHITLYGFQVAHADSHSPSMLHPSSILFEGPTDSPSDGLQVKTSKWLILSHACAL